MTLDEWVLRWLANAPPLTESRKTTIRRLLRPPEIPIAGATGDSVSSEK